MSWDNNNLACILVFPPWQRKGLGSLLMGVSYEISRRERVLGGPEKPISDLGRKGYKRFWAGEIARWLLELDLGRSGAGAGSSAYHDPGERAADERGKEDEDEDVVVEDDGLIDEVAADEKADVVVVDIQMCSRATWIVPEDCLAVLREMGLVEKAEPGPAALTTTTTTTTTTTAVAAAAGDLAIAADADEEHDEDDEDEEEDEDEDEDEDDVEIPSSSPPAARERDHSGTTGTGTGTTPTTTTPAGAGAAVPVVPRVRIDKAAVRRWVRNNGVDLRRTCDPRGFVDGYGYTDGDGGGDGDGDGGGDGVGGGDGDGVCGKRKRMRMGVRENGKGRKGMGKGKGQGKGKGKGKRGDDGHGEEGA